MKVYLIMYTDFYSRNEESDCNCQNLVEIYSGFDTRGKAEVEIRRLIKEYQHTKESLTIKELNIL